MDLNGQVPLVSSSREMARSLSESFGTCSLSQAALYLPHVKVRGKCFLRLISSFTISLFLLRMGLHTKADYLPCSPFVFFVPM